jgi:hypothetical protein
VGERRALEAVREVGSCGEDARWRERPRNVLASTLSVRLLVLLGVERVWLRSRVRPLMECSGDMAVEDSGALMFVCMLGAGSRTERRGGVFG